jgi:hypothetical protein
LPLLPEWLKQTANRMAWAALVRHLDSQPLLQRGVQHGRHIITAMKLRSLAVVCMLSSLLGVSTTFAAARSNPYSASIAKRNLFRLNPAPSHVWAPPPTPVPDVRLHGITTLPDGKRALLRVPQAARPPGPAKEISLMLSEGAPAKAGVQVLEINVPGATAKILNNGIIQILSLPGAAAGVARPVIEVKQ